MAQGSEVGTGYIAIMPSSRDFPRALRGQIEPGIGQAGRQGGHTFGGAFKTAALGILGAGLAVGAFLKGAYTGAAESLKIGKLTAQVIKTTGQAANITAAQVSDLAGALSEKTGVDDELIQSGANMLLTFTNVRNEVGKGNDVFNQANAIVTDMSVALGQDAKAGALQLGKALNDPIKGVSALSRVGVSFTEKQKALITSLVDSGDILGAQKVILGELSKEFGGAAAAAATGADRLAVKWGNFQEAVGGALIPLVDKLATSLGNAAGIGTDWFTKFNETTLTPAFKESVQWFEDTLLPILKTVATFVAGRLVVAWNALVDIFSNYVIPAVKVVISVIGNIVKDLTPVVVWLLARLGDVTDFLVAVFVPIFKGVFAFIKANANWMVPIIVGIGGAIAVWKLLQLALLVNPFVAVIVAVVALGTLIYKNWETIKKNAIDAWNTVRDFVIKVWETIKHNAIQLWNDITGFFVTTWNHIRDTAVSIWNGIIGFFKGIGQAIKDAFTGAISWLYNLGKDIITGLGKGIKWVWDNVIVGFFIGVPKKIAAWFAGVITWLLNAGKNLIEGFINGIRNAFVAVVTFFKELPGKIWDWIKGIPGRLLQLGKDALNALVNGLSTDTAGKTKIFGDQFVQGIKTALKINSPSRVMFEIGRQLTSGLMMGLVRDNPIALASRLFGGLPEALKALFTSGKLTVNDILNISNPQYTSKISGFLQALGMGAAGTGAGMGAFLGNVSAGGNLSQWLHRAMAITGVPESWYQPLVSLVMHESGGNPRAINLWDRNAIAGIPSKGLLQTIDPTFNAYAIPGLGDIWDPVANAVAAIRYMLARYGSIFNIASYTPTGFVGGYELGSNFVPRTGPAIVHRGEEIIPAGANAGWRGGSLDEQRLAVAMRRALAGVRVNLDGRLVGSVQASEAIRLGRG